MNLYVSLHETIAFVHAQFLQGAKQILPIILSNLNNCAYTRPQVVSPGS